MTLSSEMSAREVIEALDLAPLPKEGGFFREFFRSDLKMADTSQFKTEQPRALCAEAYFLLTKDQKSKLHRLDCDEVWHFQAGGDVEMVQIPSNFESNSSSQPLNLNTQFKYAGISSRDQDKNESSIKAVNPTLIVPRNSWQGARLISGPWALFTLTTSPGFEFEACEFPNESLKAELCNYDSRIESFF